MTHPMTRRGFLKSVGVCAVAAQVAGPAAAAVRGKPNVVLIISDDQGYTDYGFMGHKVVRTPHLDRLASQSLVFTRGYVPTALCCPSLATMCTGLYAHQHRITGNDPVRRNEREAVYKQFVKCPRLPEMLARNGYVSFQSGKWWMGHYSRGGFTDGMTVKGRHGEAGLTIGRKTMKPIFDFIDAAKAKSKPFFVWYAPFLPHTPHNPPKRLREKYKSAGKMAAYYAMCEWFDETCGQLLGHLDKQGLAESTMVVYVCDNGWPAWAKGSPYDLGMRTPIMIRWPGRVKARTDKKTLASSVDIVPTILAACGQAAADEMQGVDLLDAKVLAKRKMIFGENFAHDMADIDKPAKSLRARVCIEGNWKLLLWVKQQPSLRTSGIRKPDDDVQLFDLAADPTEKKNLAAQHPQRVAAMTKHINEWWSPGGKQ